MLYKEYIKITSIVLHKVGNKLNDEGLILSKDTLNVDKLTNKILLEYFISSFKYESYYNLYHGSDLKYNEVFGYVSDVFDNPNTLFEKSISLAKHLYEKSIHPKIKGGEFYVVYFKDCIINGETIDAVGLFKSENKDVFLKVYPSDDGFEVESQQGVNINKLDKGCLIFNTEREDGYLVAVVDNTNKNAEAHYWVEDFLHVSKRKDEHYNTQNVLSMCKNFVTKELPTQFEITKAEQSELLIKSLQFFKDRDSFNIKEFTNEVISQPEVIDCFNKYKENYQQERELDIANDFAISEAVVKKQARVLKSVIKLDKNFEIYIHGNNQYIKKGYDEEKGMNYYQLFFQEEQ